MRPKTFPLQRAQEKSHAVGNPQLSAMLPTRLLLQRYPADLPLRHCTTLDYAPSPKRRYVLGFQHSIRVSKVGVAQQEWEYIGNYSGICSFGAAPDCSRGFMRRQGWKPMSDTLRILHVHLLQLAAPALSHVDHSVTLALAFSPGTLRTFLRTGSCGGLRRQGSRGAP